MTSPHLFAFALLPVFGLPSIWECRPQTQAAQPGTDFSNVYAGGAAVPPVFFDTPFMMAITNFGNDMAVPLLNRNTEHQPEQPNLKQLKDLKRFVPCSASLCDFES